MFYIKCNPSKIYRGLKHPGKLIPIQSNIALETINLLLNMCRLKYLLIKNISFSYDLYEFREY